ncbi:MAG: O-antigen ligase family protein [Opitutaceae bacterium]|nr:O-antigen ligase family protein [Opitutaceae bacterium]
MTLRSLLPPAPDTLFLRSRWAIAHAALVVLAASWMFGGKIWWSKPILCLLVSPSLAISLWEFLSRRKRTERDRFTPFRWLIPMAILSALVVLSAFIPNLFPRTFGGETRWFVRPMSPFWPGSPDGGKSLRELWLLSGCYLTGFNLFVCVRSRHGLRLLLRLLAANGFVLAVFGTLQKLMSQDIFFGLQHAPTEAFFATFVYHNHWGAFSLLMGSACLGLVFHHAFHRESRYIVDSPALLWLIALFFIAATIPLSTSRSSTVLIAALIAGALCHGIIELVHHRHRSERRAWPVVLLTILIASAGVTAVYKLGERTILDRLETTREQWDAIGQDMHGPRRSALYRDTLQMAADKPWFGWGLESYERIFPVYNSTPRGPADQLPIYYQEAHSDWLQSLAEIGLVGTVLLLLSAAWPLWKMRRRIHGHPVALYLLAGCLLVVLYAALEFPFANPAVVASWWVLFFAGLRYAALSEIR